MNAITARKSRLANRIEGLLLSAVLQGFPLYASVLLMMKLIESRQIVGSVVGPAIFALLASLFHAWLTPKLAARFPRAMGQGYEPVLYDASLSCAEKIALWRVQPKASVALVSTTLMLSLLAVAAVSVR